MRDNNTMKPNEEFTEAEESGGLGVDFIVYTLPLTEEDYEMDDDDLELFEKPKRSRKRRTRRRKLKGQSHQRSAVEKTGEMQDDELDLCSCGTVDSLELARNRLPHLLHSNSTRTRIDGATQSESCPPATAKGRWEAEPEQKSQLYHSRDRRERNRRQERRRTLQGMDSLKLAHKRISLNHDSCHETSEKNTSVSKSSLNFKLLRTKDSKELHRKRLEQSDHAKLSPTRWEAPKEVPAIIPRSFKDLVTKELQSAKNPEELTGMKDLLSKLKDISTSLPPRPPLHQKSSSFHRQVLRHRSSSSLQGVFTGVTPNRNTH